MKNCPNCQRVYDDSVTYCPNCQTPLNSGSAPKQMGFVDAVKSVFSKYATFSGRARRSEYWYFHLFTVLASVVLSVLGMISQDTATIVRGIYSLAVLLPSLAVCVRRLHDVGKSGWNLLWILTVVGAFYVLYLYCKDSQPDANAYGPNPKF